MGSVSSPCRFSRAIVFASALWSDSVVCIATSDPSGVLIRYPDLVRNIETPCLCSTLAKVFRLLILVHARQVPVSQVSLFDYLIYRVTVYDLDPACAPVSLTKLGHGDCVLAGLVVVTGEHMPDLYPA